MKALWLRGGVVVGYGIALAVIGSMSGCGNPPRDERSAHESAPAPIEPGATPAPGPAPDDWQASAATLGLYLSDGGTVCHDLLVDADGDASTAVLGVSGSHGAPASLSGTLTHGGQTVPAFAPGTLSPYSGSFSASGSTPGLTGNARGAWTLCLTDGSYDGYTGYLDSWGVYGSPGLPAPTPAPTPAADWVAVAEPNAPIMDFAQTCAEVTVNEPGDASTVRVELSGRHDFRSSLRGTLERNGMMAEIFPDRFFPSGRGTFALAARSIPGFAGDAAGVWRICVTDVDGYGDEGVLERVAVMGDDSGASDWFGSTAAYLPIQDATEICTNVFVGADGDASTVRVDIEGDHSYRAALRARLTHGGTSVLVFDTGSFAASAGPVFLSGQPVPGFTGSAMGEWQLCIEDTDTGNDAGSLYRFAVRGRRPEPPAPAATSFQASAYPGLALYDYGMACTQLWVEGDGNSSSVKMDVRGNHTWMAALRATLGHNGYVVEAFPTSTFAPTGGVFELTGRAVPGIAGSANGSWELCVYDTDGYGDYGMFEYAAIHD